MAKSQLRERDGFSSGDLPEGWSAARLGELLSLNYGKALREDRRNGGSIAVYGSNGIVGRHDSSLTRAPTIIVGRKGSVGEVHYSGKECWPIDTTYFIDDFRELAPRYVFYALRFLRLSQQEKSSAIPGLSRGDAYERTLPIAPDLEQKRIVAKIDALLACVDAACQRLAKLPAILKRFRQSVLAAACSGRLTADWRQSHISKSSAEELSRAILLTRGDAKDNGGMHRSEPLEADCSQLSDVPEEWTVTSLDQLSCLITSGSRGWAKYYSDSGPLFIRAQDINTDRLRFDGIAHVKPPQNTEGSRTRVQVADLLVTVTGANVTKTALVDLDLGEAYVSQHVALVRPVDALVAPFVHLWIVSPSHGRKKLLGDAYGAGKPGLNLDNLREVVLALPPLAEQQEIVRRVQTLFKFADAIEKRVAMATARAEKLAQSILARAFRGELVPTESELARREGREYEPATALLARIADQRDRDTRERSPRLKRTASLLVASDR